MLSVHPLCLLREFLCPTLRQGMCVSGHVSFFRLAARRAPYTRPDRMSIVRVLTFRCEDEAKESGRAPAQAAAPPPMWRGLAEDHQRRGVRVPLAWAILLLMSYCASANTAGPNRHRRPSVPVASVDRSAGLLVPSAAVRRAARLSSVPAPAGVCLTGC